MSLIYSKETGLKALLDKGFRGDMESTSFQTHIESDVGMQKPIDKTTSICYNGCIVNDKKKGRHDDTS